MVTGGAGYIGAHAVLAFFRAGRRVLVVDDLSRGHAEALLRCAHGRADLLRFVRADVADKERVGAALREHGVKDVLHFAACADVGESVREPLAYHRNNAAGSIALLEACLEAGVERFVFSSSAATYGIPPASEIPIQEETVQAPINAYGRSKLAVEWALADVVASERAAGRAFGAAALRYFNVAGCDRSGSLGEVHEPETHLIPVVLQHLRGLRDRVTIYGDDYPTPDGTCVRDYIHVEDLIAAHMRVLGALRAGEMRSYNLGIGRGYSVREVIDAAQRVTGWRARIEVAARRPGDPPVLCADPSRIRAELGWVPEFTDIDSIVESAWTWFARRPRGYRS
jgi:UDP-glucose 4-epimerase